MNRYFYIDADGNQKGTFSPEELQREGIKRDTLVWTQGMEQWKRAEDTEELKYLFAGSFNNNPYSSEPVAQANASRSDNYGSRPSMPKTWLVESILVTILPFMFCGSMFSLLGIIAIVYAAQVESFYNRGDYAGSLESSHLAAKWTKITMWVAIGWMLLIILSIVLIIVFVGSLTVIPGVSNLLNTWPASFE